MENQIDNRDIHRFELNGKKYTIIGTSHVSKESADLVTEVIESETPDTVCVELCESRYHSMRDKDRWRNMDIVKVIKEEKTFLLLSNLLLASFQKRIAEKFDIIPGMEMVKAIESAEKVHAGIHLADRDVQITLSRTWRKVGFWEKIKIMSQILMSASDTPDITEEEIENMKDADVLQNILGEVEKSHPVLREILIDERDKYLAHRICEAEGQNIVAVVGAGHVPGIKKYFGQDIDIEELKQLPPKSIWAEVFKWGLFSALLFLFVWGFFKGGAVAGTSMLIKWSIVTGTLSGIGAIAALGHPLTILAAILAAPVTCLHPLLAAGWVSGLVEAYVRKPKVMDLENLNTDIMSFTGFWKNKVTRILLVVMFTNIGASIGTFVALPMLMKYLGKS
ncbi:TraB/GumN family protein [Desulforegula conservatrix]|uniref:TraB/GumN family protein n=1 Tax=Desulforegula conservatrix TaxID=153026 RepID=UPI00041C460A|nr:TraB/GumN family protein [Desulforegula conservatrix]